MVSPNVLSCSSCGEPFPVPPSPSFVSPFLYDSLASTNDPASDADAAVIRSTVLPRALEAISSIDAQLGRVSAAMKALRAEQKRLEDEKRRIRNIVSQSRGLLSAFRRFPPEILAEIFLYLGTPNARFDVFNLSKGPWPLTHVARSWRAIAINTPALWSHYNFYSQSCPSGWKQQLTVMLQRAETSEISLQMECTLYSDEDGETSRCKELEREWFTIMVRHSSRWKSLSLYLNIELAMDVATMRTTFPRLESISLTFGMPPRYYSIVDLDGHSQIHAFAAAPLLTNVTLSQYDYYDISLPYPILRNVALHPFCSEAGNTLLENVLTGSPRLHTFTSSSTKYQTRLSKTFFLPSLRALRVVESPFSFTAPALETMRVILATARMVEHLISSLRQSRPPLLNLSLEIQETVEVCLPNLERIVTLLCLCPSLENVDVYIRTDTFTPGHFIEAIQKQILPTLTKLKRFEVKYRGTTRGFV